MDRNNLGLSIAGHSKGSLSARRAWIEISARHTAGPRKWSLSARRAWIEIADVVPVQYRGQVALRKESVDRNTHGTQTVKCNVIVALRKESVDRNKMPVPTCIYSKRSLSARRAWIEIVKSSYQDHP